MGKLSIIVIGQVRFCKGKIYKGSARLTQSCKTLQNSFVLRL